MLEHSQKYFAQQMDGDVVLKLVSLLIVHDIEIRIKNQVLWKKIWNKNNCYCWRSKTKPKPIKFAYCVFVLINSILLNFLCFDICICRKTCTFSPWSVELAAWLPSVFHPPALSTLQNLEHVIFSVCLPMVPCWLMTVHKLTDWQRRRLDYIRHITGPRHSNGLRCLTQQDWQNHKTPAASYFSANHNRLNNKGQFYPQVDQAYFASPLWEIF